VPIFITVDPERDTPAGGQAVRGNFHPRFVGLTGSPAAIAAVAKQYAVYFKKEPPGAGGGYLVGHSQIAYLMDPNGKPITSLPIEKDARRSPSSSKHWVR
jgi:protein SCO1/2